MKSETIRTVASIIDPKLTGPFTGTAAVDALLDWADEARAEYGAEAQAELSRLLVSARHDLVAEMFAATMLYHLEQMDRVAGETGAW